MSIVKQDFQLRSECACPGKCHGSGGRGGGSGGDKSGAIGLTIIFL